MIWKEMSKDEALAYLSEGWCPVCQTKFEAQPFVLNGKSVETTPLCGSRISYEAVRRQVEELKS